MPMLPAVTGTAARVVAARIVVAFSAFLLLSMGGAIVAAPLTLPLLYLAVRKGQLGAGLRVAAVVVAGLTVAEVAWAATYLAISA
jgi:hypothetical protein